MLLPILLTPRVLVISYHCCRFRTAYDGCAPDVKYPGDDSPVVWGACGHAFHLQVGFDGMGGTRYEGVGMGGMRPCIPPAGTICPRESPCGMPFPPAVHPEVAGQQRGAGLPHVPEEVALQGGGSRRSGLEGGVDGGGATRVQMYNQVRGRGKGCT